MASITVPRLQKIQPRGEAPNARLNVQVRDQSQLIQQTTKNISAVAAQGIDLYLDIEDNKITQLSNEVEQDYTRWSNAELIKLKSVEGDPTDAYAEFEIEEEKKSQEFLTKRPDLNDRVKRHVEGNFNKIRETRRTQVLNQRGMQQETYANKLYESNLSLKGNDLPVNAGYIRKDDSSSFFPFDQNIQEIKTAIAKRGITTGTVKKLDKNAKSWSHLYTDGNGEVVKVQMTDIAKHRTAKELSSGVSNSIKVLIDGGQVEEAKLLRERYKSYIDPLSNAKLEKKFKETDVKGEAFKHLEKTRGKDPDKQLQMIESISNPEVRAEALKIKDTNDKRRDSIRKRKSTTNYDTLANHIINKQSAGDPFFGASQLEADPVYKQTWDNIEDPKQKKAILEFLEPPKESAPVSQAKIQNLFFGNDEDFQIETITPSEFNIYLNGLAKKDRSRYSSLYTNLRTETSAEQRSNYKRSEKFLSDQLFRDGYLKKDDFGHWTKKSEKRLIDSRNELIDYLSDQYGTFSDKQLKDFVLDFSATKVKDEVFKPAPRRVFDEAKPSKRNLEESLTDSEKRTMRREYKNTYGQWPDLASPQYQKFILNNR